ncbi:NAD(+)/NADH kinase [Inconstantimicrobium mannanitabidum]|uniref:NAD kinase n=1 Tax=Inconstantimicrobium mannanitabidum TaxID=1604901 RepID=A0ACB5RAT8_9CLOT|nr:NAD(+)/NADH kinase [Clostridium sp. TW13]GKX66161.1 NAD kinase [Clostridium sp. TW13]
MKKIGININGSKDKNGIIYNEMVNALKAEFSAAEIYKVSDKQEFLKHNLDLIFILGGDGTILRAAREFSPYADTPILGINIGNLGFLSTIEYEDLTHSLKKIKNKEFRIEKRLMLKSEIKGINSSNISFSLNDLVISRGTLSRMAKYNIEINGEKYIDFKGDGVIVSTPTGSTAYSFSAGGPIVYPTLKVITITPICPHAPSIRPIVIDENSKIKITATATDSVLYASTDGQKFSLLEEDFEVLISKSDRECNLIVVNELNYYDVLSRKLIGN